MKKKIVVADNSRSFREILSLYLRDCFDDVRIFEARNTADLEDVCLRQKPDLVITQFRLPPSDCISVIKLLERRLLATKFIIVTGNPQVVKNSGYMVIKKSGSDDFVYQIFGGVNRLMYG